MKRNERDGEPVRVRGRVAALTRPRTRLISPWNSATKDMRSIPSQRAFILLGSQMPLSIPERAERRTQPSEVDREANPVRRPCGVGGRRHLAFWPVGRGGTAADAGDQIPGPLQHAGG